MNNHFTVNEDGEISCPCGNEPSWCGFVPCHEDGTEDDTLLWADSERKTYWRCESCGRIAEEETLQVIGNYRTETVHGNV